MVSMSKNYLLCLSGVQFSPSIHQYGSCAFSRHLLIRIDYCPLRSAMNNLGIKSQIFYVTWPVFRLISSSQYVKSWLYYTSNYVLMAILHNGTISHLLQILPLSCLTHSLLGLLMSCCKLLTSNTVLTYPYRSSEFSPVCTEDGPGFRRIIQQHPDSRMISSLGNAGIVFELPLNGNLIPSLHAQLFFHVI